MLFLGTNDLKPRFALPAHDLADGVRLLVEHVLASRAGPDWSAPAVVVLGIPRFGAFDPDDERFAGVAAKLQLVPELLRTMTDELGVGFVDLSELTAYGDGDARHLDAEGHAAVGHAAARAIGRLSE